VDETPRQLTVGMAEGLVTCDATASLVTYALGSCVAVAVHDRAAGVAGMAHVMLPESSLDPERAGTNPYRFADTGVPLLLRRAFAAGAEKRRLAVYVTGGALVMDDGGVFNIGKRNYLAVRRILWKAGVMIHAEDVGGTVSRTVRLDAGSGRFYVRAGGGKEELLEYRTHAAVPPIFERGPEVPAG
jgi:chemotaxis protein CheD